MTTKAPNQTMTEPNFASAEYAERWQRGKRMRGEVFAALTVWSTAEKNPFFGLPLSIASHLAKIPLPGPGQPGLFALSGQGVLGECYTKAGFRDVAVRAVSVRRHFPSTAEAIEAMKGSFPRLQVLLNKVSDADRELAWSEIEQQLKQFEGPNGFEAPGEWLVGVGTK